MDVTEDDRDEAYHSGLYILDANSTELAKERVSPKNTRARKSPSPGTINMSKQGEGQSLGFTSIPSRPTGGISIKSLSQKNPTSAGNQGTRKLDTPMSSLAGRFTGFKLQPGNEQGKSESPTSEFDSGVFPSLPESAYGSMQSAPSSIVNEKQQVSPVAIVSPITKEAEHMDVDPKDDSGVVSVSSASQMTHPNIQSHPVPKPRQNRPMTSPTPTPLSTLQAETRMRSESPCVPPVGESVEVFTDTPSAFQSKSEGFTRLKRSIDHEETEMWHHKKTPRLSDVSITEEGGMSQKPIRVKTIVSPAGSPRPPRRRGVSPHRSPRGSRSPVSINVSEDKSMDSSSFDRVRQASLSPSPGSLSPNSTQQPVVNFRDIGDLAKSANPEQGMMYVAIHPSALQAVARGSGGRHTPILLGVGDMARRGQSVSRDSAVTITPKSGMFVDSTRSPKRGNSPIPSTSTATVFTQLLATRPRIPRAASPGRASPTNSPRSTDGASSDKKEEGSKVTDNKEGKDGKPAAGNALLQVTEAHLATLSDEDGDTPLHLAIIHENSGLTQYLVKLIVGVYMNLDIANNMRQTPLHLAVITRQPHMVQLLVGAGASVNFPDRKGNTALHLAAGRRDVRILQLLAQATNPLPDYNAKNFSGLTAVHVATKEASIDVLKFFFQMGANKNAPDACSGRTALHYAVESENFTLVNFLLENNVNVNASTFSGNTPLHVAAGRRLKEIVALLMAYGANPAIANGEGDFPSDLPASLLMQRAKMHNAH